MSSLKTVLATFSIEKRNTFLEKMVVANGTVINIDLTGVPESEVETLMQETGCTKMGYTCSGTAGECKEMNAHACNAAACKTKGGAVPVALGTLLQQVAPTTRHNYLNSIDYKKGHLIAADTELLGEHLANSERSMHLPSASRK